MIEKAFAIEAEAGVIWDALWQDLTANGSTEAYEVAAAHRPHELGLHVTLSGIPCLLTYRITAQDQHCEVAAQIIPSGLRYRLSQILTVGHFKRNFEMILVQGLFNLKQALEPEPPAPETQEVLAEDA